MPSLRPESMLVVVENVIFLQVFYRGAQDDMFKELTTQTCEGDRSIVSSIKWAPFYILLLH